MLMKKVLFMLFVMCLVRNGLTEAPKNIDIPDWLKKLEFCLRDTPPLLDSIRDLYNDFHSSNKINSDVIEETFNSVRTFANECLNQKLPQMGPLCSDNIQGIEDDWQTYNKETNVIMKNIYKAKLLYDLGEAFKNCYPKSENQKCINVRSAFSQLTYKFKNEGQPDNTTKQMIDLLDIMSRIC